MLKESCIKFIDVLASFDYYKDAESKKVRDFINKASEKGELGTDLTSLLPFTKNILEITASNKVPSNVQVKFLDSVKLFGDTLCLRTFKSENRKTKKIIIKHLSNIIANLFSTTGTIPKELEYILQNDEEIESSVDSVLGMFQGNEELNGIVEKMTRKLTSGDMDPMQLLSSIMIGDTDNSKIQELIGDVKEDFEKMDKTKLEGINESITKVLQNKNNGLSEMMSNFPIPPVLD